MNRRFQPRMKVVRPRGGNATFGRGRLNTIGLPGTGLPHPSVRRIRDPKRGWEWSIMAVMVTVIALFTLAVL